MKQSHVVYSAGTVAVRPAPAPNRKDREQEEATATKTYSVPAQLGAKQPIKPIKVKLDQEKLRKFSKQ